jgi:hypothetical protein
LTNGGERALFYLAEELNPSAVGSTTLIKSWLKENVILTSDCYTLAALINPDYNTFYTLINCASDSYIIQFSRFDTTDYNITV